MNDKHRYKLECWCARLFGTRQPNGWYLWRGGLYPPAGK